MSSCPSLVVSCPTFDVAHPREDCKGKKGDFLTIGKRRFGTVFQVKTISHLPGTVGPRVPKNSHQNPKDWQLHSNPTRKATKRVRSARLPAPISLHHQVTTIPALFFRGLKEGSLSIILRNSISKHFPPRLLSYLVQKCWTHDVESIVLSHLQFPPVDIKVYSILSPSNFARKNLMECTNLQIVDHSFIT